eukprot:TRINITY_DN8165_c0_g1_i1.p1 TRINITY_DN8165_c0_g1~~TRINITY_DN8165_c0_g1_i1.p1  ORF type:complete len:108 (-),score=16.06 TRINITY_DN8165_c0_g1_i1:110-433(-)
MHKKSPLGSVPLEYNLPNKEGYVSLARDSEPNSGSSEFFILLRDNTEWLGPGGSDKYGYTVFAKVVKGWDVIMEIAKGDIEIQAGLPMLKNPVKIFHTSLGNDVERE